MAHLEIKKIENFFYLFKASGCHLKYFVIWKDGENPYSYNWHNVRGEEPFEMIMNIDNNNGIHFHVYDGNSSEDFRGQIFFPPDRDNDAVYNKDNNYSNRRDNAYDDRNDDNNLEYERRLREKMEQRELEMEQMMQMKMQELELEYQKKIEQIKADNEREKQKIKEERRRMEDEKRRREEEERRKKEEYRLKVNNSNNELKNLDNNLLDNYKIKLSQKDISSLYDNNKLLDILNMIPKDGIHLLKDLA